MNLKNGINNQLIVHDIESKLRKEMGDKLYGEFEIDPETGQMISKKGQSDAARRAAKRTMQKRAEDVKRDLLNIMGSN